MFKDPNQKGLQVSFVMIIIFMTLMALVGLSRMLIISNDVSHIVTSHNVKSQLVKQMREAARERSIILHNMAVTADAFLRDEQFMEMRNQGERFLKARAKLHQTELDKDEQSLLARQFDLSSQAGVLQYQVIDLLALDKQDEAIHVLVEQAIPVQDRVLSILDEFTNLQVMHTQQYFEDITDQFSTAYMILIPLGISILVMSIFIAIVITRKITAAMTENKLINRHLQNAVTMLKNELAGRKRMQKKVRSSEMREKAIREHILDAIITIDDRGMIRSVNPAAETMFGYSTFEMLGNKVNMLMRDEDSTHHDAYINKYIQTGVANIIGRGREVTCKRKDGSVFPADLGVSEIELNGKRMFIGTIHDISAMKAIQGELKESQLQLETRVAERTQELLVANEQLEKMANYDSLTNLANRAMFCAQLKKTVAHACRSKLMIALMFIDLDGFKEANDNYGHDEGDKILKTMASRIQKCVRDEDLVARMGGDEFVVAIINLDDVANVQKIAEKLIEKLNKPYKLAADTVSIGASIGISIYPDDSGDIGQLLKYADNAMYRVKRAGKNAYQFYDQTALEAGLTNTRQRRVVKKF